MDTNLIHTAWIPIGPGDPDCVWIETEEDRENERRKEQEIEDETKIETEEDVENESDKENK